MGKNIVSTKQLGKTYYSKKGEVKVLQDINIDVEEKEIIAIMGGSGSGKTTFAKILAGIEDATEGQYFFRSKDCSSAMDQETKKHIAFIFQNHNLLPWLSVEKNIMLPLEIFHMDKTPDVKERVEKALEIVGLTNYRTCLPQELSGGMMQRVGIARTLAINADLMVLDQPFGALDAITRRKLYFDFLHIFRESSKTIVIVTNSIEEAILFSKRIYMFNGKPGRVNEIIDVDIPYEERTLSIFRDQRFIDLRVEVMACVKRQIS